MMTSGTRKIAYFVSPHGFGHAARAAAVMDAIHRVDPSVRFEVFTRVPEWFFRDSVSAELGYRPILTDIGLAQETPFREDLSETLHRLDGFMPFDGRTVG